MATTEPQPGRETGGTAADPGGQPGKKRRNYWVWACVALAVVAVGLLIWALDTRSQLDDTQSDLDAAQQQADQNKETGSVIVGAFKTVYDELTNQLGATNEDLASAQQDAANAKATADKADQEAAAAKDAAAKAKDDVDKANAEADQAKAAAEASKSEAAVATDCAKAYVSAFGALFEGGSVTDRVASTRKELQTVTASCKDAFAG